MSRRCRQRHAQYCTKPFLLSRANMQSIVVSYMSSSMILSGLTRTRGPPAGNGYTPRPADSRGRNGPDKLSLREISETRHQNSPCDDGSEHTRHVPGVEMNRVSSAFWRQRSREKGVADSGAVPALAASWKGKESRTHSFRVLRLWHFIGNGKLISHSPESTHLLLCANIS